MPRIAVAGFHHETNSFVAAPTDFTYFASHRDRPPLVRGSDVIAWLADTSFALSGFLREMAAKHAIVPLLWTSGGAGGPVTAAAYERIAGKLVGRLSQAMPVDAVYLDLHGAMVSAPFADGEGELLRRVRAVVGEEVPIALSLDYHANVTPAMVALTDSLVGYRTYPHVDRPQTGHYAARALSLLLARGRPAGRALRKLPFLIPLNDQCTLVEPSKSVVARSVVAENGIVNLSYLAGFPPSDLYWCGPAVIAHAWSQEAADTAADALAREIALREAEFAVRMVSPLEGVREAMAIARSASRPVVLADTQDNPGCGATADTTGVLEALVQLSAEGAVLGYLCDAEAAAVAHKAGEGADITIALGGRSGPQGVRPFYGTFRVARLGNGQMRTTGAVSGERDIDLGPMALLTRWRSGRGGHIQAHAGSGPGALQALGRRSARPKDAGAQEHLSLPRRVRADRREGDCGGRPRRLSRRSRPVSLSPPPSGRTPASVGARPCPLPARARRQPHALSMARYWRALLAPSMREDASRKADRIHRPTYPRSLKGSVPRWREGHSAYSFPTLVPAARRWRVVGLAPTGHAQQNQGPHGASHTPQVSRRSPVRPPAALLVCGHGLCSWVLPCAASVPYITARWRNRCSLGLGERRGTGIARPSLRCAGSAPLPGSASCGLLCADAQLKSAVADLGSVEHCVPCDVPHRARQVALVPGALAHWHHWHRWHHVDPRWCALSLCVLSF